VKQCLNSRLSQLLREEKIKWYQRSKAKHLLEGDANIKYFHLLANGRHMKTRIFQLQDGENIISGEDELKKHITSYYKGLFVRPEESKITLDPGRTEDIPQVTIEEKQILVEEFMEDEVRKTVFQMEHNKAPGPDEFLTEFYQVFCDLIRNDIMALFREFHRGNLPLYSLNFRTIILLPKCVEALKIQQYMPICLLNMSLKIFMKVIMNRLA
jgi:hypothetical protein